MSDARVSVVIPVRDRRDLLLECLAGLRRQTVQDFEVIIVDDGSTDGTADAARTATANWGIPVHVLTSDGNGAVAARIHGVAAASGTFLAFTDSDCVPADDWLESGLRHLEAGADIVQGRTIPRGPTKGLQRSVASPAQDPLHPTCNVFYRREAYDRVGGFDRDAGRRLGFRPGPRCRGLGFGEDTLLAWHVRRSGPAAAADQAIVHHAVFPVSGAEALPRAVMAGAFPALVKEVPELRDNWLAGRFLLPGRNRWFLLAAIVCRLIGLRLPAVLLTLRWMGGHARTALRDGSTGLATLPAVLAQDVIVESVLILGSVRARSIVV